MLIIVKTICIFLKSKNKKHIEESRLFKFYDFIYDYLCHGNNRKRQNKEVEEN